MNTVLDVSHNDIRMPFLAFHVKAWCDSIYNTQSSVTFASSALWVCRYWLSDSGNRSGRGRKPISRSRNHRNFFASIAKEPCCLLHNSAMVVRGRPAKCNRHSPLLNVIAIFPGSLWLPSRHVFNLLAICCWKRTYLEHSFAKSCPLQMYLFFTLNEQ